MTTPQQNQRAKIRDVLRIDFFPSKLSNDALLRIGSLPETFKTNAPKLCDWFAGMAGAELDRRYENRMEPFRPTIPLNLWTPGELASALIALNGGLALSDFGDPVVTEFFRAVLKNVVVYITVLLRALPQLPTAAVAPQQPQLPN